MMLTGIARSHREPLDADTESEAFKSWEDGWRKAREHDYDESDG